MGKSSLSNTLSRDHVMYLFTLLSVIIGFLIIIARWWLTVGAFLRTIHDPTIPIYQKAILTGHGFWGYFIRAVIDGFSTTVGMGIAALVVKGNVASPIGGAIALILSTTITGLPFYNDYIRRQMQSRKAA